MPILKQEVNGNVERGGKSNGCPLIEVTNTNVGDTISRQAAIDALMEIIDRPNHAEFLYTDEICKTLNELSSAQPEPSTEIQEILEYLDTTLHPIVSPDNWNVYSELHDMVSRLPSAQLEIIKCKYCKYYEIAWLKKDGTDNKRYKPSICVRGQYGITRKPDWFCADAERREE